MSEPSYSGLVTCVIPVFNGERFLAASLESILAQSYSNLEVLVMDDASDDRSAEIAERFAARDPRVKSVVAIAPYDKPAEAIVRFAREMKLPVSEAKVRAATVVLAKNIGLNWADWAGTSVVHGVKVPVFFIGAEKDRISTMRDMVAFQQAASPDCKFLPVREGNHETIGYWLQELAAPVSSWFQEKMPAKH